jgi:hypothetical protein
MNTRKKEFTKNKTKKNKFKLLPINFQQLSIENVKKMKKSENVFIIIPFRENKEKERGPQLNHFVKVFGEDKNPWKKFHVIVVEQSDDGRKFNRGALLNIGAKIAGTMGASSIILHDVDLIPDKSILPYYFAYPENPIHIGGIWRRKYKHDRFLGAILHLSMKDFENANGFPNNFYGWGGEDDVLGDRLLKKGISKFYRPDFTEKGITELMHEHVGDNPALIVENKFIKRMKDDGRDGMKEVKYKKLGEEILTKNSFKVTVELK